MKHEEPVRMERLPIALDAYYTFITNHSYASRIDLAFVKGKPFTMILLTHIMGRRVPLQKYA